MKILTRYIFKEFFYPFFACTLFFTVLFLIQRTEKLIELMFEKNIPISVALELFVYAIPFTMAITIPIGTLFASLYSLGRLTQDSEIVAMQANGVSLINVFKPIIFLSVLITGFLFYFMNYVMTETNLRYKSIYVNIIYSHPGVIMFPRLFTSFSSPTQQITATTIDDDGNLHSVYLYDYDSKNRIIKLVSAERGKLLNNGFNTSQLALRLYEGEILQFDQSKQTDTLDRIRFEEITFNVLHDIREIGLAHRGFREMNIFEIYKIIKDYRDNNQVPTPHIYVEFHRKISIPLACLAFIVMAIPLAINFQNKGKGSGLGMFIVVILIYYVLLTTFEALGKKNVIDPSWAMHFPNLIFGIGGIIFLLIKGKR